MDKKSSNLITYLYGQEFMCRNVVDGITGVHIVSTLTFSFSSTKGAMKATNVGYNPASVLPSQRVIPITLMADTLGCCYCVWITSLVSQHTVYWRFKQLALYLMQS